MTDDLIERADGFRLGTKPTDDDIDRANSLISTMTARIRALLAAKEAAEAEVRKDRIERDAMIEQIRNSEIVYDEMKAKLATARAALVRLEGLTLHNMPMCAQEAREALALLDADDPARPAPVTVEEAARIVWDDCLQKASPEAAKQRKKAIKAIMRLKIPSIPMAQRWAIVNVALRALAGQGGE